MITKNIFRNYKSGQTMLEVLVAVTLGGILLGGAVVLIVGFMGSNKRGQEAQSAISLSNDLIEKVRSVANENWSSFISLNKGSVNHYNVSSTPPFQILSGDASSTVKGINFKQYFYIENVYRSSTGNVVSSLTPGSALDPSTVFVAVRITWNNTPQGGITLSEFFTRTRNEVFHQTDWSGGPDQEFFQDENVNHKFATSTNNINFTASSGSFFINGVLPISGSITSSVFDSGSSSTLNYFLWRGQVGALSSVSFQLASSSDLGGPWNFVGPDNNPSINYQADNPNVNYLINIKDFGSTRYFRYKLFMTVAAGGTFPIVDDVVINYSP